jgi:hypothetical protein
VARPRSLDGEDQAAVGHRPQRIKVSSGARGLVHFARACGGTKPPSAHQQGPGGPSAPVLIVVAGIVVATALLVLLPFF